MTPESELGIKFTIVVMAFFVSFAIFQIGTDESYSEPLQLEVVLPDYNQQEYDDVMLQLKQDVRVYNSVLKMAEDTIWAIELFDSEQNHVHTNDMITYIYASKHQVKTITSLSDELGHFKLSRIIYDAIKNGDYK